MLGEETSGLPKAFRFRSSVCVPFGQPTTVPHPQTSVRLVLLRIFRKSARKKNIHHRHHHYPISKSLFLSSRLIQQHRIHSYFQLGADQAEIRLEIITGGLGNHTTLGRCLDSLGLISLFKRLFDGTPLFTQSSHHQRSTLTIFTSLVFPPSLLLL
jgi:hypothetical protein